MLANQLLLNSKITNFIHSRVWVPSHLPEVSVWVAECARMAVPLSGRVTVTDPSIEVRNIPPQRVVSLIHKGPYETIGQAYTRLNDHITRNGLSYAGPMMDLYLNDPNKVPRDEVMTEIQAPI
jgi:effector-binding domain-containing protein